MRNKFTLLLLLSLALNYAQNGAPASPYYDNISNWNSLSPSALKSALETKIAATHTNYLTYSEVWNATQVTDLDPNDLTNSNVLLLYGFSSNTCPSSPGDDNDHRTRNKFSNGGGNTCEWNREHVYAKALATPGLDQGGVSDAGEDAHHLRASDVDRNGLRSSKKFGSGSGNSGGSTTWYPGDEWKGDVARMMMYMYLRYGSQCLPINVGNGNPMASDANMIDLFLQWNADDPVSQYEDNRNTYHGNTSNTFAQGNRNPFIDNPYLATVIWGGPAAENRWPSVFLSAESFDLEASVTVYPNPTNNNTIYISSKTSLNDVIVYNVNGQIVQEIKNPNTISTDTYQVTDLNSGFYMMKLASDNGSTTKKIIVN